VEVRADLEEREVYLGESFLYRVHVIGGDHVGNPVLTGFEHFDVQEFPKAWLRYAGTDWLDPETLDQGTDYFFRLVALRTGLLGIPSATIDVDGRTYKVPEFTVRVELPPPSHDFKLSLSLSKDRFYVGEPVVLTATWYYLKQARYFYAVIPILKHPSFSFHGSRGNSGTAQMFVASSSGSYNITGEDDTAVLNGVIYRTATFKQVITSKNPGEYDFFPGTVQAWTPLEEDSSGARESDGNWRYEDTVVASNRLSVRVLPLPLQGRPDNFTGIVAEKVRIATSVTHTEMNVGDPITLNVEMWGPHSLENARIPPLASMTELAGGFTIRSDSLDVRVQEDRKLFSQTIRVKNESVGQIPPIEVPYFNTRSGSYEVATSKPIPITVRPTRLVTASDLEGGGSSGFARASVRDWEEGIRFNYAGTTQLLAKQPYGIGSIMRNPVAVMLLVMPLSLFAAAFIISLRRRYREKSDASDHSAAARYITPVQNLRERLEHIGKEDDADTAEALVALRDYISEKLQLRPGHLTQDELEAELSAHGLEEEFIREIGELLRYHDLYRYRKQSDSTTGLDSSILSRITRVASELEGREFLA
jgi:hypothetical protein